MKSSVRKYAESLNISHTAVLKAIKLGYISRGWDPENKKIIITEADKEWGNAAREKQKTTTDSYANSNINKSLINELSLKETSSNISFVEARRRKEIYQAELARITALQESGILVNKNDVHKELFEFARLMRSAFESIPSRTIGLIRSASTSAEAIQILENAIFEALDLLCNPPDLAKPVEIEPVSMNEEE